MSDNITSLLIREINGKILNQKQIAYFYARAIMIGGNENIDWKKINQAIIDRWSPSGLKRVKQMAWKKIRVDMR